MDWSFIISTTLLAAFGIEAIVFGLAAIGLNLQFGYTGLLNFGQSAFLAVAAYSLAVLVSQMGYSFWVGIVVGIIAVSVVASLVATRTRADAEQVATEQVAIEPAEPERARE